jgi:hypothetical protein
VTLIDSWRLREAVHTLKNTYLRLQRFRLEEERRQVLAIEAMMAAFAANGMTSTTRLPPRNAQWRHRSQAIPAIR